jgi:hypothetical protein
MRRVRNGAAQLRILHCPWNIGGHPGMLARFERVLGAQSHSVALTADAYGFVADEILFKQGIQQWGQDLARLALLWRSLRNFDVIHFNFGQTVLESTTVPKVSLSWPVPRVHNLLSLYHYATWLADLPILRAWNKTIVMTYQGDDARQGDYCRAHFEVTHANHVDYYTAESDEWKRRAIKRVDRFADRIYALNPDLLHVLPSRSRFLPYANVDPSDWTVPPDPQNVVPVVAHAPTSRSVKGSQFIIDAVNALQDAGLKFEFILVENMTRDEARRVYERADILVDQLLAGWYGGLAVELMALGKAVVSFIRDEDLGFVPGALVGDLPVVRATPQSIASVLRELLTTRRHQLPELGRRGRQFVETWHDPQKIAEATLHDYRSLVARRRWWRRVE